MTRANSVFHKFYADTSVGQVHGRRTGSGPAIILLHWTPLSSQMFRHLMPLLAAAGYEAIAFDLPGYGRSDPRPEEFTIPGYADVIAQAMQAIDIDTAKAVLGGHNGASVAVELCLRHTAMVERLVVDGIPFLTPELREILNGMAGASRPKPSATENIEKLPFNTALHLMREYTPGVSPDDGNIDRLWEYMIDYMETDFVSSGSVAGNYVAEQQLPQVMKAALVLGAETDSLSASYATACELLPQCQGHFFNGDNPIYSANNAHLYAEQILSFLGRSEQ